MRVILGITGSVAAYKGAFLARLFVKRGHSVTGVLTRAAGKFITPLQISSLTGDRCFEEADFFAPQTKPLHIELAESADLLVVAPASYDFIGKAACGIADGLLLSVFSAFRRPVIVAPAMHSSMWNSPLLRENVEKLRAAGVHFVGPVEGALSSGETGTGRMADPEEILRFSEKLFDEAEKLKGKKILIAYGRTEEEIDPVRVITNRSSGKMGYYLAERAKAMGAHTILVEGEISYKPPVGDEKHKVRTHAQMREVLIKLAPQTDVIIMSAAVPDFRPEIRNEEKIKRGKALELTLVPTCDILAEIGKNKKKGQVVVGFALESRNLEEIAREKLVRKNLDIVVGNTLEAPGSDFLNGFILDRQGELREFKGTHKAEVASVLFEKIAEFLGA